MRLHPALRRVSSSSEPARTAPRGAWRAALAIVLAAALQLPCGARSHYTSDETNAAASAAAAAAPTGAIAVDRLPGPARETLARIHAGGPFPYAKDGIRFGNFEGRLPRQSRNYYSEYTVRTPGSRNRGARRIIAGRGATGDPATSGEYYYTDDHYQTFQRIREAP